MKSKKKPEAPKKTTLAAPVKCWALLNRNTGDLRRIVNGAPLTCLTRNLAREANPCSLVYVPIKVVIFENID